MTQAPINSGFTAASTADDVIKGIDLTGKVAIVTGGYSGIGTETTRVLRAAGATVIVPARSTARAQEGLHGIDAEIEPMDLIDPASVHTFAERFLASGRPLHILVNSAGIMATPLTRDARGYEAQFATNHLGHFQLVTELWPALRSADGARIVSLSSWGHRYSDIDFDDPNFHRRDYDPYVAYGQSKTANVLLAVGADTRGKDDGIRAFAVHPGSIADTNLGRHIPIEDLKASGVLDQDGNPVLDPSRQLKTVEQGAATSIWCATSPQLDGLGGVYCQNSDIAQVVQTADQTRLAIGKLETQGVMPYAINPESAERLWKLSETLV